MEWSPTSRHIKLLQHCLTHQQKTPPPFHSRPTVAAAAPPDDDALRPASVDLPSLPLWRLKGELRWRQLPTDGDAGAMAARLASALGGSAAVERVPSQDVCNALTAFELRDALRAMGVPAPKAKADALTRLVAVMKGEWPPRGDGGEAAQRPPPRGRRPKAVVDAEAAAEAKAAVAAGLDPEAIAIAGGAPTTARGQLKRLQVRELRTLLEARGVKTPVKSTKAALIAELEALDAAGERGGGDGGDGFGGGDAATTPTSTTTTTAAPLTEWTMAELRAELRARGERVGGTKNDLVARLAAARASDGGDAGAEADTPTAVTTTTDLPTIDAPPPPPRPRAPPPRLAAGEALLPDTSPSARVDWMCDAGVVVEMVARDLCTVADALAADTSELRARMVTVLEEEDAVKAAKEAEAAGEGPVKTPAPLPPPGPPLPRVAITAIAPWREGGSQAALDGLCTLIELVPTPAEGGGGDDARASADNDDDDADAPPPPPPPPSGITVDALLVRDGGNATPARAEDLLCSADAADVEVALTARSASHPPPSTSLAAAAAALAADATAVAFPVLAGAPRGGEEVLAVLAGAGVAYVGPPPAAAALADDRPAASVALAAAGLRPVPHARLDANADVATVADAVEAFVSTLVPQGAPPPPRGALHALVVKPASRAAPARPVVVRGAVAAAEAAAAMADSADGAAVVEPFVATAVAWRVAVIATDDGPIALTPIELDRGDLVALQADVAGADADRAARGGGYGDADAAVFRAMARAEALARSRLAPPRRTHMPPRLPLATVNAIRAAAVAAFDAVGARDVAIVDGFAALVAPPPPPPPPRPLDITLTADQYVALHPDAPDDPTPMPDDGPGLELSIRLREAARVGAARARALPPPPGPTTEGGGHAIMVAGVDSSPALDETATLFLCAADAGIGHAGVARHLVSRARSRAHGAPPLPPPPPPVASGSAAVLRDYDAPPVGPEDLDEDDAEVEAGVVATWRAAGEEGSADPAPISGDDAAWTDYNAAKAAWAEAGGDDSEDEEEMEAVTAKEAATAAATCEVVANGFGDDASKLWNRAARAITPSGLNSPDWPFDIDMQRTDFAPIPPPRPEFEVGAEDGRAKTDTDDAPTKPVRVWILAGGDGPGADEALAGGRHAALALAADPDVAVEAFLLAPFGGAPLREPARARAAYDRRAAFLDAGIPEANLGPGLSLDDVLKPEPTDEEVFARAVWALTPAALLRTSAAAAAAAADADAAVASLAPSARSESALDAVAARAIIMSDLDAAGVTAAGSAWGVGAADRAAAAAVVDGPVPTPAPRRLDIDQLGEEAAAANAVILLSLAPGDPDAHGAIQAALRFHGAVVGGPSSDAAAAAADATAVATALAGQERHCVSVWPRLAVTVDDLQAAASSEAEAASLLERARAAVGGKRPSLLLRAGAGGAASTRPAKVRDAAALMELAVALTTRAPEAPDGDGGTIELPPWAVDGALFEPDWPDGGASLAPDPSAPPSWKSDSRWLRMSMALVGERGAMRSLVATATLATPTNARVRVTPPPPSLVPDAVMDGVRARVELAADALGMAGGAVLTAFVEAQHAEIIVADVAATPPLHRGGALLGQALAEDPPVHAADALRELARLAVEQAEVDAEAAGEGFDDEETGGGTGGGAVPGASMSDAFADAFGPFV